MIIRRMVIRELPCAATRRHMDLSEPTTHSFIVRIWLEEVEDEAGEAIWRGRIVHVLSGEERYFEKVDDLVDFIFGHLGLPKPRRRLRWLFGRWFRRRRRRRTEIC